MKKSWNERTSSNGSRSRCAIDSSLQHYTCTSSLQAIVHIQMLNYNYAIKWNIARLIWIGFYKNNENDKCLIQQLSKDVISYLLSFLGPLRRGVHDKNSIFLE